jgi:hypothetical protein
MEHSGAQSQYLFRMSNASGPGISKWASLLLVGDVVVFSLSVLLGYLLGAQIRWEELFLQEHILSIVILCLVYLIVLYIGELYNYYLDFRERENITPENLTFPS